MAKLLHIKQTTFLLLFNLCTLCGYAQYSESDDRTFYGGVVVGGNFSQVDGDNFAGYHKVGFNGGFISYVKLGENLAASMEILYSQKGSKAGLNQVPKVGNDQTTLIGKYSINLHYAEVPIIFNYFDKHRSNFGAGVSYSRLVGSKEVVNNIIESQFPFRKSDYNLLLNGNVNVWKGLFVNLRFAYSVRSLRGENTYNPVTGRVQQYNHIWCIRTMYLF
jgi:hypothetical protein